MGLKTQVRGNRAKLLLGTITFLLWLDVSGASDGKSCPPIQRLPGRMFRGRSWRHGKTIHLAFVCPGEAHQLAQGIPSTVRCEDGQWMDGGRPVEINDVISKTRHLCALKRCPVEPGWRSVLPLADSYKPVIKIKLLCPPNNTLTDFFKSKGGKLICQRGGTWNLNLTGHGEICRELKPTSPRPVTVTSGPKHETTAIPLMVKMKRPQGVASYKPVAGDARCRDPVNAGQAKWLNPGPLTVGSTAVFTCDRGHMFVDGRRFFVTRCVSDGKVPTLSVKEVPKCRAIPRCDRIDISNAEVTPDSTHHPVGQVVIFLCLQGYKFDDGTNFRYMRCQEDGRWDRVITEGCKGGAFVYRHSSPEASGAGRYSMSGLLIIIMGMVLV